MAGGGRGEEIGEGVGEAQAGMYKAYEQTHLIQLTQLTRGIHRLCASAATAHTQQTRCQRIRPRHQIKVLFAVAPTSALWEDYDG